MPNWCEGTIKVRGKSENVGRFLTDGLNSYIWDWEKKESVCKPKSWLSVDKYEGYTEISVTEEVHIDGTRRAFIDAFSVYFDDDKKDVCVALPFRQAWGIRQEDFEKLSTKYGVDFRLYGIECGMEFCQEIIVENGKTVLDNYIHFNDWTWECSFPYLGG